MADIDRIQISVTNEGLEDIANMIATGQAFTIGYFRLTNFGDTEYYDSKKSMTTTVDPDTFYMPYTAADFEEHSGQGVWTNATFTDTEGYANVNSVELSDALTVEINCYIPPAVGSEFDANEIMIYTGSGTVLDPYRSFIWGIFPSVSKLAQYGLNFRVLVQF
jgi:hypothetical protein